MLLHLVDPSLIGLSGVVQLFSMADFFLTSSQAGYTYLKDADVFMFFQEDSTRTRLSFDISAQRLGARVVHFCAQGSSLSKGETIDDTLRNMVCLGARFIVVRHAQNDFFDRFLHDPNFLDVHFISAGHGSAHHPTQGLIDVFCINRHRSVAWADLSVAVVGDIVHSRVARSQVQLLRLLGCRDIRLVGPSFFLPDDADPIFSGLSSFESLEKGIEQADVVSLLRVQKERLSDSIDLSDYVRLYSFQKKHGSQMKKQGIVIHPQPVNRGIEVFSDVLGLPCCKIWEQVRFGVAVRMACFCFLEKLNLPLHAS